MSRKECRDIYGLINNSREQQGHDHGQVTDRVLKDWIFEDLFEGPTERGLAGGGSERRY